MADSHWSRRFSAERGAAVGCGMDWWKSAIVRIVAIALPRNIFQDASVEPECHALVRMVMASREARAVRGNTGLHRNSPISPAVRTASRAILPIGAYEPSMVHAAVHMKPEDATEAYLRIAERGLRRMHLCRHIGDFRLTDEPLDEPPAADECMDCGPHCHNHACAAQPENGHSRVAIGRFSIRLL